MGLLGKFLGSPPAKKPTDDVLLLHAIMCMAAADGMIEPGQAREFVQPFPGGTLEQRMVFVPDGEQFFDICSGRCIRKLGLISKSLQDLDAPSVHESSSMSLLERSRNAHPEEP